MKYTAISLQGLRDENQDCFRVWQYSKESWLLVLADGMGGHADGEKASKIAIDKIIELAPKSPTEIELAFVEAHEAVRLGCHGGTTLVVVVIKDNIAYICGVGDSRGYLLHDGVLERVTEDDNVFGRAILLGDLDAKWDLEPTSYSTWRSRLTACLGGPMWGDIDPKCKIRALEKGDKLILGSDGLWQVWNDIDLQQQIEGCHFDANAVCSKAIKEGSTDNTTAVIFEFDLVQPEE